MALSEKELERHRRKRQRERDRFYSDPTFAEKKRDEWKIRARQRRKKCGEKVNEYNRDYYRRNKEKIKQQIYNGKDRRDPTRGLKQLIQDVRSGRKSPRELIDKISEAADKLSALILRE